SWSTARRSRRSSAGKGTSRSRALWISPPRSAPGSARPTRQASSTATSNPTTCSSPAPEVMMTYRIPASLGFFVVLGLSGAPGRSAPCSNGGDCQKIDTKYGYCLQGRCVECISNSGCGDGNTCVAGVCDRACEDGRDCAGDLVCENHRCRPRS